MTLPPLPLPDVLWPDRYHGDERAYSADAMHAYAEQAVAAAQQRKPLTDERKNSICRKAREDAEKWWPDGPHFVDLVMQGIERAHGITGETL